uniref:Uncharacterized protein n=1 Tax=Rhizophora mucronata TaxID=61149 RepID=A0A2P2J1Q0_RHIMU
MKPPRHTSYSSHRTQRNSAYPGFPRTQTSVFILTHPCGGPFQPTTRQLDEETSCGEGNFARQPENN